MEILRKQIEVKQELKTADIFKILQDISAEHCSKYQLSMNELGKKGLIWVVVRQFVQIMRRPETGEKLELSTWPGATRHMMFPRFYVMKDEKGEVILKGSAIWTILDSKTREMIIPQNYGIELEALVTGDECRLPSGIKKHEYTEHGSFTVPEEYIDANMHMNNTCYYTAAENCIGEAVRGRRLKEAVTEYVSEAVLGEEVKVSWDVTEDYIFVLGENQGTVFKMKLLYE